MAEPAGQSDSALLLDAALDCIPYGFCVWSDDFRLLRWNRLYLDLHGFPPHRIKRGMTLAAAVKLSLEVGNYPGSSAREFVEACKKGLRENSRGTRLRGRVQLAGGRWIETAYVHAPGLGWVMTHEDVTEQVATSEVVRKRSRALEKENVRLDAAVNNISQGLCMYDAKGRLVICNAPYARIYGLPARLLRPGTPLDDILNHLFDHGMMSGGDRDAYFRWRRNVIGKRQFSKSIHELNGRTVLMQHHPIEDGGWVTTHEDITEQRQQEERIRYLALHDPLTELPNRERFIEELATLEAAVARGEKAAVLTIDLDRFKGVNDSHGHVVGDKVLKQASARLWGTTRETDMLSRLGADEFALLLRPIERPADAAAIAERIVTAMAAPFSIDGCQVAIGASVGIAMAPADGDNAEDLMKSADMALRRAKDEGRAAFQFFETGMDRTIRRRRELEAGLRLAIGRGELRLEFQPLLGLGDGRITCFEALLRWDHATWGAVPPDEFIPVAEETGAIIEIGEWVLREACAAAARWPAGVRVAVNLSAAQFRKGRLFETVVAALNATGLSASRLEVEITESLLLADNRPTLETLHRLRALGVRISMDDFGTGYSSLSYLCSFPFDKIKIDRSFMRDIGKDGGLAIVRAMVGLGRSFGMTTTAEGVETAEQLEAVRDQGCDEIQGFYFSPPLRPEAVPELLRRKPPTEPRLRRVS